MTGACPDRCDSGILRNAAKAPLHSKRLGIGLAGNGYWGRKLLRNLESTQGCVLLRICDPDPAARARARQQFPVAETDVAFESLTHASDVDAIVIATPPASHFSLAERALMAGKHVLVEKPLATSLAEAERLVRLAEDLGLVLMVDHTFRYSPAVEELGRMIASGVVGEPRHIDSVRSALGRFSAEVNVVWDTAVHDFSIFAHILGRQPVSLSARGGMKEICGQQAYAHIDLVYHDGLTAHVHASWLGPDKLRRLTLSGTKGAIVYEDGDMGPRVATHLFTSAAPMEVLPASISKINGAEPLARVIANFRDCILGLELPLCAGFDALPIMRMLDAADRSMARDGAVQLL